MGWVRYLAYFLGITVVTWLLVQLELSFPGSLDLYVVPDGGAARGTSEYSPIEIVQPLLLLACAGMLAWVARFCPSQRPLTVFFAAFALIFLVRELRYFLDRFLVENLWQLLIGVIAALAIVYLGRHQRRARIALARIWPAPALGLIFSGAVIEIVFARLVGREALWMSLLGADYQPVVAVAVEEFLDLLGYLLWTAGTIEYTFQARALAYREPQPAARRRRAQRRHEQEGPY